MHGIAAAFPARPPPVGPGAGRVETARGGPTMLETCRARAPAPSRVPVHFDTPHPDYTGSPRVRDGFRLALKLSLAFGALLWAIQILNFALDLDAAPFGVTPRTLAGLAGVLFAPLMHGSFEHLIANTLPVVILGTAMLHLYPRATPIVLPAVWLGPGLAVWLLARGGTHLGASGLVYGLCAYVFVAGLIRRDRRALAASMVVAFLYGASVWGVLPIQRGHSWETHLAAALIGLALAFVLRHRDVPPKVRYDWEDRDEAIDLEPFDEAPTPARMPEPGPTVH
jgi:membrane associated rhomboid family serine protease